MRMMSSVPSLSESAVLGVLDTLLKGVSWTDAKTSELECHTSDVFEIEKRINSLLVAAEAFRTITNAQIARYRRLRNSSASRLLQLPDELLSYILEFVHLTNPGLRDLISTLRLVCVRFYRITESTPTLWSYIKYSSPKGWGLAQLIKSKMAPLTIDVSIVPMLSDKQSLFANICRHMNRWESLSLSVQFRGPPDALNPVLGRLAEDKAPLLREINIKLINHTDFHSLPVDLFQGDAPHLRRFNAPSITVSWDNPVLSGLTYLDIYAWDGFKAPSAGQYARILGSCPELETFNVEGREADCITSYTEGFRQDIYLPKLKSLTLQFIHPLIVQSILYSVRGSPEWTSIAFHNLRPDNRIVAVHDVLGPPPVNSILSNAYHLAHEVEVHNSNTSFQWMEARSMKNDGRVSIFLCQAPDIASPVLFMQSLLLSTSRVRILIVDGDVPVKLESYPTNRLFEELPGLEELRLSAGTGWPLKAMSILSIPLGSTQDSDVPVAWLCPNLRKLQIRDENYDLSTILTFVKTRYQHPSGHSPTRLSCLSISKVRPYGWAHEYEKYKVAGSEIAEIVGKEVFYWEERILSASGKWEK